MQQAFDQYLPELEKQWIWFRQHQKAFKELRDKRFAHVDASLINKEYKLFEVEPPTWNTMKQAVERLIQVTEILLTILHPIQFGNVLPSMWVAKVLSVWLTEYVPK